MKLYQNPFKHVEGTVRTRNYGQTNGLTSRRMDASKPIVPQIGL